MRKDWTKEEEDFLRRALGNLGVRAVAEHLGRSYLSVEGKAHRMGITTSYYKWDWTPEKIEYLKANYPIMITDEVAEHLGMTRDAVYHKAKNLHLSKSPEYKVINKDKIRRRRSAAMLIAIDEGRMDYSKRRKKTPSTAFKKGRKPTPEQIEKAAAGWMRVYKAERRRVLYGLPQKTNIRVRIK